jgi:hypothetical protein
MNTKLPTLLISATLLTALSGCYYYDCPEGTTTVRYYQDPAYVEVQSAPPPLRAAVDVRPPKPNPGAAWVAGHYAWRGSWVWVDGHWETPRAGYVWTAPTVVHVEGGFRYHPGYWRPRTVEAAPVYRQPGRVRVSVRPATTTVRQGGTQSVTVQGGNSTGTATVEAQPSTSGNVTVQGGTRTNADPDTRATVRVRSGTRTNANPGTRATVGVQSGTRTNASPGTATNRATVSGGVRTADTPTVRQQGGNVRVQTPTAGTRSPTTGATVRTSGAQRTRGQTATVRGGVRAGSPGTAATNVGTTRQGTAGTVALTCRANTERAPRGGYITISGTGFGTGATVMIGGNIAAVSRARSGRVRAQVPRDSNGGAVTIRDGNRRARCGNLTIVGR